MSSLRRAITTRVLDPIIWTRVKRIPLMTRLEDFRACQSDTPEVARERQLARLADLMVHAASNVPFYREAVGPLDAESVRDDPLACLARFPILTKADLRDRLDDLMVELGRGTFLDASGGSTGEPTRFYKDAEQLASSLAATQVFLEWAGIERAERHIKLWGARRDLRPHVSFGLRLSRMFYGRVTLDAFDMGEETMREYLAFIRRHRPVVLEGYATALNALAQFVDETGEDVPPLRAVVSSASTLHPHMRERVERVFGAPVYDRYGGREVGGVAAECPEHSGLHIFTENVFLELLKDDGTEAAVGEEGEILITGLWNHTMPMIRFRIGDRAVRGPDRCACGRPYPLLKRIVGRNVACFRRADGGFVDPIFWVHMIGVEFNEGEIVKFQIVQEDMDTIRVRLVPRAGADVRILRRRDALTERIREALGAPVQVTYTIEEDIPPAASGKHIYTISRVSDAEA